MLVACVNHHYYYLSRKKEEKGHSGQENNLTGNMKVNVIFQNSQYDWDVECNAENSDERES